MFSFESFILALNVLGKPLKTATSTTGVSMSKRRHTCQFCAYKECINANRALDFSSGKEF